MSPYSVQEQLPTFYPRGIHSSPSQAMGAHDDGLNAQGQMSTVENLVLVPAPVPISGGQILGSLGNVEENLEEYAPLSQDAAKRYEHLIGVQLAYFCLCLDPNMTTSGNLPQQALQDLKDHCARDALVLHYDNNPTEADTTVIQQQSTLSAGSSQVQQYAARGFNNMIPSVHQQEIVAPALSPTLRLMDIKGQVTAFCAEHKGSHFIQKAVDVATPQEILMVYVEIMPCVLTLAVDKYGNHAMQKILEHEPQSCKRKVISNLIGHVVPLSLNKYSCRVIQKAFDVEEHDQKLVTAKELSGKVLKCVCHRFANHVIQKCIECLPPEDIHFILRCFCGSAIALSIQPYGCHVIQKVLARCDNNQEIFHALTAEIIEFINELSADKSRNYVVQQLLEHGDHAMRSTI